MVKIGSKTLPLKYLGLCVCVCFNEYNLLSPFSVAYNHIYITIWPLGNG
jgi:hypothetical protein